jgi:hydrophobe/amphiphile efflux-1 (HAE1) family protein
MDEVTGPVVAVALVLCAVFVPCAFISGITGQFFRQFALTIAVSTVFSAFNSLTLSPALAAILLKPHGSKKDPLTLALDATLGWFFRLFNKAFAVSTDGYTRGVGVLLRVSVIALVVYAGLLVLTGWSFNEVPAGFIPQQDKGQLLVNVQLPDSSSVQRTQEAMEQIDEIASKIPGVEHTVGIAGKSLLTNINASNLGSLYVMLKPFHERHGPGLSGDEIAATLQNRCRQEVLGAAVGVFGPPPVDGLGTVAGFKMMVEDRGGLGLNELQKVADHIVDDGNGMPGLQGLFTSSRSDTPWLYLDIDRTKCESLGVSFGELLNTLQIYVGSLYVNNFNEFGRMWQVNVQAGPQFRGRIEDLKQLKVKNKTGEMVPIATLGNVRSSSGPVQLLRYNMYSSAAIYGNTAPGTSSGQAVQLMDGIANRALPRAMMYEWTELTFMQIAAGSTAMYVFALAVVFVFLVLAAQYESWKLPLAVILVVPMCLLCSVVGVALVKSDINIFTQIGFIVLVGLASKNAILIVEFAKQQQEAGKPRRDATLEACRLRLRPILMTSFAFILGVVPLVIAEGAGAEMRRALGVAVFSGMLGVTLFGIFLTPIFYYVIMWFGERGPKDEPKEAGSSHSVDPAKTTFLAEPGQAGP